MTDITLFISDLHLCADRPAVNELFLTFLRGEARQARALYILGDLFEFWIGDEAVAFDEHRALIAGLRELADGGVPVQVMPGNRDFLMGPGFERASGCVLLPDPTRIDLYGTPVLLMHGDSLCTRDTEYMAFRKMVRDPAWQRAALAKPLAEREAIARKYREISMATTSNKKPEITDVTPSAVDDAMRAHQVRHFIHGHTHRPAEHVFTLDGAPAYRTVLGDWYDQGSVLRVTPQGQTLERLS
jgi:UDP-2,3-diacylglucosamine hydrolase